MWEKFRIRERERLLGMLFVGVWVALGGYVVLTLVSGVAAMAVAITMTGVLCVLAIAWFRRFRRNKRGRVPTGPLSGDERAKARSKLLKPKQPSVNEPGLNSTARKC
jgi:hypothetical protein